MEPVHAEVASLAVLTWLAVVAALLAVVPATGAHAVAPGLLPANTASSWQTNGTVRAIAHANGVVYLAETSRL